MKFICRAKTEYIQHIMARNGAPFRSGPPAFQIQGSTIEPVPFYDLNEASVRSILHGKSEETAA